MTTNWTQSAYQHHTLQDVKAQISSHSLNSTLYLSMAFSIYMISRFIVISGESMMIKVILCSLLFTSLLCCSILISIGIILIIRSKHAMGLR